ncbi:MAG: hypothetical protein PWQ96_1849 [Clostridia bacterium]|jgi:uncharacterized lipoprotein|nr:hypothetical protein [Clostridia bacterium]
MQRERKLLIKLVAVLLLVGAAFILLAGCSSNTAVKKNNTETVAGETLIEGFPPPIPHDLKDKDECLVCHREGEVGKATKVTHPELTNCRQCHVLEQN